MKYVEICIIESAEDLKELLDRNIFINMVVRDKVYEICRRGNYIQIHCKSGSSIQNYKYHLSSILENVFIKVNGTHYNNANMPTVGDMFKRDNFVRIIFDDDDQSFQIIVGGRIVLTDSIEKLDKLIESARDYSLDYEGCFDYLTSDDLEEVIDKVLELKNK